MSENWFKEQEDNQTALVEYLRLPVAEQLLPERCRWVFTSAAPGVCSLLERSFPGPELMMAFGHALRFGGLEEVGVSRVPGASFNPRPARLMQILFAQGGCCDLNCLIAGCLASMNRVEGYLAWGVSSDQADQASLLALAAALRAGSLQLTDIEDVQVEEIFGGDLARQLLGKLRVYSKCSLTDLVNGFDLAQHGAALTDIVAALLLDTVRHLHMLEQGQRELVSKEELEQVKDFLLEVETQNSRLIPILRQAVAQQQRRIFGQV